MKTTKFAAATLLAIALAVLLTAGCNRKEEVVVTGKPYPLDTCLVCDMKLAGMGTPAVFVYQGQQIKVCDKSEKADFDKDPAKFMKKLAEAEAKIKK